MIAEAIAPNVLQALTEAQSGLWYAQRLDKQIPLFNTGQYVDIEGPLDAEAFKLAVDKAVAEADALALRMLETADGPRQFVDEANRPWLQIIDLSRQSQARHSALAAIHADSANPTDPTRDPLAVQRLFVLGGARFIWYQRIHHLAIDGYGVMLLNRRIAALYQHHAGEPLAPLTTALVDDRTYRGSDKRKTDAEYWRSALTDLPEAVGMAPGRAVSAASFHRGSAVFTPQQRAALQDLSERAGMPWPDVLTALSAAYCQRFAATPEIVVGVPHMGRFGSAAARVPAMVMNVLPFRIAPNQSVPIGDYLAECGKKLNQARRHGRYRSEQMRRDLGLIGGQRRLYGPLINVLPFDQPLEIEGLSLQTTVLNTGPVDDITFTFRGDGRTGLSLGVDANPDLYEAEDVADHAQRVLAFIDNTTTAATLGDIATAMPAEAHSLVNDLERTRHALAETTLTALITAKMAETPDAQAVVFDGQALSYAELDRRSTALAAQLQTMGVGRETLVAVALPRSMELIVALVGVLRAGGAYLPLDFDHPDDRLARIVGSAKPKLALINRNDSNRLPDLPVLFPENWAQAGTVSESSGQPDDAAYVIYTSGSTGEPKGVLIEHRAIVNRLVWMAEHYSFTPADRILQKTPATFDVSVWEFFLPLVVGATLIPAPPGAHRDPTVLAAIMRDEAITTAHFVPSMLAVFLSDPASVGLALKRVFCSGEELTADLRNRFHTTIKAELHNLYGPTEAAVDVSYWDAGPQDSTSVVPIGFPVWNTALYVLDDALRPVPHGVTGHLYLGGVQLARGYVGRPDLTAERFIADPFVLRGRMYDTGDLALRRRDGAVVYLGRSDQQVKIRGLRIELGEIETVALQSGLVRQVVVIARQDGRADKRLVAYVVAGANFSVEALRTHLLAQLPDYMVPAAIVPLDGLPVTGNGKLDRAALPAPQFTAPVSRAPSSQTETLLARLFTEILDIETPLGVEADFFSLGGDSLSAVNLLLAIHEVLGRDTGLGTVFEHPTIAALAAEIDREADEINDGLGPLITLGRGNIDAAPLFVVHPAGGIAWCYRDLARALAPRRSVYGLQAPALDPAVGVPESLDALAATYVDRLLDLDTPGPVHLTGWSVGGLIVQAMAVRLQALGREVGLVAMLDSYPSECWRAEPEPDEIAALRSLLSIAGYDPESHPELTSRAAIVAFLRDGDSPLGRLPEATLDGVTRVVMETNRLVRNHYHQRFEGTLTHIRAALDHVGRPLHPELWLPYATRLDHIAVPFLHPQLTGAAATAQIAPQLLDRLDTIDRERRS